VTTNPISFDEALRLGHQALSEQRYAEAKHIFEQIREQRPANVAANEALADIAAATGHQGIAAALYLDALHHGAGNGCLYKLGLTLLQIGGNWDARACFAHLRDMAYIPDGKSGDALEDSYDKATAACREDYLATYGIDPDADFPRSSVEIRHNGLSLTEGQAVNLVNELAKAAGPMGSPEIERLTDLILAFNPRRLDARLNRAVIHAFAKQHDLARRHFLFALWHWPAIQR